MNDQDLMKQFGQRLRQAMLAAGYSSSRAASGINIHKLVEITNYSIQICRKYIRGEAIPEPKKLIVIAENLNVSPGWLLFGDSHANEPLAENKITINKNLLYHIFQCANALYAEPQQDQEIASFLLTLTNELSQMQVDEMQSKQIIEMSMLSIKSFLNK